MAMTVLSHSTVRPPRIDLVSRRGLLTVGGAVLVAPTLTACDAFATDPAGDSEGSDSDKGQQAPELAEQVQAGDLPAVGERLPTEPMVVTPVDRVGVYGGTWHSWLHGVAATHIFQREVGYEPLVRWDPEWNEIVPNLAESWEIEGDGREYIFTLRDGLRWSDGEPFTADDIVFGYDHVVMNRDLTPVPPDMFMAAGEPATVRKIDEHTVRFVFAAPNGVLLDHLASLEGMENTVMPAHYLRQFHTDHNDDADERADAEGHPDWVALFLAKNDEPWSNTDRPTMNAWRVVEEFGDGNRTVFERNPYYWKVDPEGSQLPYLDRVTYETLDNLEAAALKTAQGEFHFNHPTVAGGVVTTGNKPTLARGREEGGYRFVDSMAATTNEMGIGLNLNHQDPVLREIFNSKDFRIGLSHAIDREELIQTVYQRQGEPWQLAPREESDYYLEEMATQYIEFDLDLANEHLDRAGFTDRNDDGIRLGPRNRPIQFSIGAITEEPNHVAALNLIRDSWREVGVDMRVNNEDRTLHVERREANEHDAFAWTGGAGFRDALIDPWWFLPVLDFGWAPLWSQWYLSDGEAGEEPPAPAKEQMALYDEVKQTVNPDQQRELYLEMLGIATEQFWGGIGTILPTGTYGTVRNDFHNVPEWIPAAYQYPTPGPTNPEQYFIQEV